LSSAQALMQEKHQVFSKYLVVGQKRRRRK